LNPTHKVVFTWESREDKSHRHDHPRLGMRLKSIAAVAGEGDQAAGSYVLHYGNDNETGYSLLKSVERVGTDGKEVLPRVEMAYSFMDAGCPDGERGCNLLETMTNGAGGWYALEYRDAMGADPDGTSFHAPVVASVTEFDGVEKAGPLSAVRRYGYSGGKLDLINGGAKGFRSVETIHPTGHSVKDKKNEIESNRGTKGALALIFFGGGGGAAMVVIGAVMWESRFKCIGILGGIILFTGLVVSVAGFVFATAYFSS
jgi:hypothetical protein